MCVCVCVCVCVVCVCMAVYGCVWICAPYSARATPIPLHDASGNSPAKPLSTAILLGFLANEYTSAIISALWGHFAATGDMRVVDRVATMCGALGEVLDHVEWAKVIADVGATYTVSGPLVAIDQVWWLTVAPHAGAVVVVVLHTPVCCVGIRGGSGACLSSLRQ